ncbi:trypco2 family protein [Streptomyces sp. NPDC000880]
MAVRDNESVAGLAEVIGQVRDELERAQRAGEGRDLKFSVERVNLEFAVQVRREGGGRAELRIGVVTAGGGGTAARDTTHTIQIELKPQGRDGDPNVRVGGE